MTIAQITDHVARTQARLLQQFKDSISMSALAAVIGKRAQVLENAFSGTDVYGANLYLWSSDLTNAAWTLAGGSIAANAALAPDGSSVFKLNENVVLSIHSLFQTVQNLVSGNVYVSSRRVHAAERSICFLINANTAFTPNNPLVKFDLGAKTAVSQGGTVVATGIIDEGGGWFRIWMAATASASGPGDIHMELGDGTGTRSYTGTAGAGMLTTEPQFELSNVVNLYNPTTSIVPSSGGPIGILTTRKLSAAYGQQLDEFGNLLGLKRNGLTDDVYRRFLNGQILINISDGAIPNLENLFLAAGDVGTLVSIAEFFPACIEVRVGGVAQTQSAALAAMLLQAKSAGVKALLVYNTDTEANTFTLEPVDGILQGATIVGATSFQISVADAALYPAAGSVVLAKGTTVEETVNYSVVNRATGVFTCTALVNAHAIGDACALTTSAGSGTDAHVLAIVNGTVAAGATSVLVVSTTGFPASGTIIIAKGTVNEETINYTSTDATHFFVAATQLQHLTGDVVQLSVPVGGKLTGIL